MIVEQATIADLPVILAMRQEASDWTVRTDDGETAATVALDSFSDPSSGPRTSRPSQRCTSIA